MGRYRACMEVANEAIKLNPEDWELYYTIGNCYQGMRDYQKSINHYKKAFDLSKNE